MNTQPIQTVTPNDIGGVRRTPSMELDKDGFLKLLVEQMRHQDPTAPQDLGDQMAQVSQMSIVEQLTNLASDMTSVAKTAKATHAQSLVGRTVTYLAADGAAATGVVEGVALTADGPRLTVAGVAGIDPDTLTEVK